MAGNENGSKPVLLSKADLDRLRLEQQEWSRQSVRRRVAIIGRSAGWLVENCETLAEAIEVPHPRPVEQTLAAELLPLADAVRFIQRQAVRILSTKTLSNGDRPLWMGNVKVRLARDPLGVVLVLGTWNYPLFLTGVHIVQALAAGNGVLLKPSPGAERVSELLCRSLWESGVPRRLLQLLPSGVEHARNAMDLGVDRVVLTGSSLTGRRVLGQLVETLTPATLELSGCDAMFVLSTADLNRVCDAILLGLRLNGSATCIAPRRVLIMPDQLVPLQTRLKERLQFATRIKVFPAAFELLKQLTHEAIEEGAEVLCGDIGDFERESEMLPLVMTGVRPEMRLVQSDLFAPVVSLITVNDWAEAIAADRRCPYALSASVFGATAEAEQRAMQIEAGCVVINDCIVPTADPRVPFGGRGESGYGMTRGAEGLLEMTRLKSICVRKGNWVPHLEPPHNTDRSILSGLFKFQHGATWRKRWEGMKEIWKAIRERQKE